MNNVAITGASGTEFLQTLKGLLKGTVDAYEIFFSADEGLSVESQGAAVDALKVRANAGVGLRVIANGKLGFGFSTVLTADALQALVQGAVAGSAQTDLDRYLILPSPEKAVTGTHLDLYDGSYPAFSEQEKIERAVKIEAGARETSPKIRRIRKATYGESSRYVRVVSSTGVDVSHRATFFSGHVTAVAEDNGDAQTGWEIGLGHRRDDLDPYEIGRAAALDALRKLGARTIKNVRCPAVFENTVVCELLEALAGAFLGDNVYKGRSMLKGKLGESVVSSVLNIVDDGTLRDGWASSVFDGEGVPQTRTTLVTGGVLKAFLYDTYWGGRAGTKSTGNAGRSGYKNLPTAGISNLYMEKGAGGLSRDGLLKKMERGLLITELMGVHTVNAVTGDFSLGASGHWVEGGETQYPVRGMAIAGNLLGLFSRVTDLADDIRFIGSIGAPSIMVDELEASGR